jgi:hypothetical protein
MEEVALQRRAGAEELDWAPIGVFATNRAAAVRRYTPQQGGRLMQLADDAQNVHTPEVQSSVAAAVRRLQAWAAGDGRCSQPDRDLAALVAAALTQPLHEVEVTALDHLRHCYDWSDGTLMFGVTYPQLASWVWARASRPHENRELLIERFCQEVAESVGQCLNGNMSRLMNTFAAIDADMSPQTFSDLSMDQLGAAVAHAVNDPTLDDARLHAAVSALLQRAQVADAAPWLEAARAARE